MVTRNPVGRTPVNPNLPLTYEEQLLAAIRQLHADLVGLNVGGGGGGIELPTSTSPYLQTVLASQQSNSRQFLSPTVSSKVTVLARLMSNYADYGISSRVETNSINLQDVTKFWRPNIFLGQTLYVLIGDFLYNTVITSNTNTILTFLPLQAGAQVDKDSIYWIQTNPNSVLTASIVRWGIPAEPTWVYAAQVVAPLAGAVLVNQLVGAGFLGYIFGFLIASQEPNSFLLNWISGGVARSKIIIFGGAGTLEDVNNIALNTGLLADPGTVITITNINAGGAGIIYQANLLYAEL